MSSPSLPLFIVDDEPTALIMLSGALEAAGFVTRTFTSAEQFLSAVPSSSPGVLITDLGMEGLSGLDLIQRLADEHWDMPVVVITIHQDVSTAVRAIKAGALEYLCKPVDPAQLVSVVNTACSEAATRERQKAKTRTLLERLSRLSPREREVFALVVSGLPNKLVAAHVGLAEKTVEIHRAHVMKKMEAESFAHLVRIAVQIEQAGVNPMPARAGVDAAA